MRPRVYLVLANWGYNTDDDRKRARYCICVPMHLNSRLLSFSLGFLSQPFSRDLGIHVVSQKELARVANEDIYLQEAPPFISS